MKEKSSEGEKVAGGAASGKKKKRVGRVPRVRLNRAAPKPATSSTSVAAAFGAAVGAFFGVAVQAVESQQQRWIPVTEALPLPNTEVLVLISGGKRAYSAVMMKAVAEGSEHVATWKILSEVRLLPTETVLSWRAMPSAPSASGATLDGSGGVL